MARTTEEERAKIDMEAIERDYRNSYLTLTELSVKHGVSPASISRWARIKKWQRESTLQQRIAKATKTAVKFSDEELDHVTFGTPHKEIVKLAKHVISRGLDADQHVEAAVATNLAVVLGHRRDLSELRSLSSDMMAELRALAASREQVEALSEIAAIEKTAEIEDPGERERKKAEAIRGFILASNLQNRSAVLQRIADVIGKVIDRERQAFSLDEDPDKTSRADLETTLRAILEE